MAAPRARMHRTWRSWVAQLSTYTILLIAGIVVLVPFVLAFFGSFKTAEDFFTYPPRLLPNVAATAEVNGEEPSGVRNDGETWAELATWDIDGIVISPGPGTPERPGDFGVCADAIRHASLSLLAVCLGHQGLAHIAGGSVVKAPARSSVRAGRPMNE